MSTARELKPCPFCGHVGLSFSEGSTFRWLAYSCDGCGIGSETRVRTVGDGTPEEWAEKAEADAIAAWNTRQPGEGALTGWPCEIAEADFEANTVTVRMMTNDYRVRAGKYVLAPVTSTPTGDSNG